MNAVAEPFAGPEHLQNGIAAPASFAPTPPTLPPAVHSFVVDAASHVPTVATPPDPSSIPIHAPHGTPPPPPGTLLPEVAAAEDMSAPPTAVPSVFTPPPATPTPPTDPEPDPHAMDEDPAQPSPEIRSATPQPDTDLTASHAPLGADPLFGNPEDDVAMAVEAPLGTPPVDDAPLTLDASLDATPNASLLNGNAPNGNGFHSAHPNGNGVASPAFQSTFAYQEDDGDQPPPAKRQKLEPSVSSPWRGGPA